MQKRSKKKIRNAGLWDISASGHVRFGENDISSIIWETYEETKYKVSEKNIIFLLRYVEHRKFNKKFIDNVWRNVYVAHVNTPLMKVHDLEVEETKFFSLEELQKLMIDYNELAYKPEAFEAIVKYMKKINKMNKN